MHLRLLLLAVLPLAVQGISVAGRGVRTSGRSVVSEGVADAGAAAWELDLASFSVAAGGGAPRSLGVQLVTVQLPSGTPAELGGNVSCVNCDPLAFVEWVQSSLLGLTVGRAAAEAGHGPGSQKHPNAPGYDAWQKQAQSGPGGSFLARRAAGAAADASVAVRPHPVVLPNAGGLAVSLDTLLPQDLEARRPGLQALWASRRLVLGPGPDPLHQRLGFVEALVHLARRTPALLVGGCDASAPHCYTLISDGLRPSTTAGALYNALVQSFGPALLQRHTFNASWTPAEQRFHAQALLLALKGRYRFYRQTCLAPAPGAAAAARAGTCSPTAASDLVGRIACRAEEDGPSDGCVYAELRRCGGAACAAGAAAFFEYARMHGPVALLQTRETRSHIMGQCEEFSRAAFAMFASLGYEARYVLDFTDHVWVELRLLPAGGAAPEWVHADPSEGILDQPLIYEQGWGKELTMIFAMTPWSVEHVTERYTANYTAAVQRRGISEEALQRVLAEAARQLGPAPAARAGPPPAGSLSRQRSFADLALWSHFGGGV